MPKQTANPADTDSPEDFAKAVLASPALLDAVISRLAFVDEERLQQIVERAHFHLQRKADLLAAAKEPGFGARLLSGEFGSNRKCR